MPADADPPPAAAARIRSALPLKLLLAGGGALLLIALAGGLTWALWPQPAATRARPVAVAGVVEPAASAAASAASSPDGDATAAAPHVQASPVAAAHDDAAPPIDVRVARQPAAATGSESAASDAPGALASASIATAATASTPLASARVASAPISTASSAPAPLAMPPHAAARAHQPAQAARTAAADAGPELPLERIRRRLAEVMGGRGRLGSPTDGELQLLTRGAGRQPVAGQSAPTKAAAPGSSLKQTSAGNAGAGNAGAGNADVGDAGAHAPARDERHPVWHYGDGPGGPAQWGRLRPEYAACARGKRQSPVDIHDGLALDLAPLRFAYRPGAFRVLDQGHTVQVEVAPGNALLVGARRYELQQFHFHRPSEERIDGRRYDLGVHLVHRDAHGRLAVVAVLVERGAAPLPVLQTVWNHLPLEPGEPGLTGEGIDPSALLPADRRYYTYMGSLTTPPCTEGVQWFVLPQPVAAGAREIGIFARLYPMNARPAQPLAGRRVQQSN